MRLSNQAKWYFRGHYPMYVTSSMEPTAMQELANAGLIELKDDFFGKRWVLTQKGKDAKSAGFDA